MKVLIKDGENTVLITKEDLEIVDGAINGLTITQTYQKLNIKQRTMEARVANLKAKTGCNTLSEVVALFFRSKLIE